MPPHNRNEAQGLYSVTTLAFMVIVAMVPRYALSAESKPAGDSRPQRVIHFPKDRSIGRVEIGKWRPVDPHWWQAFKAIGPARGDVTIPAGQDVHLNVYQKDLTDLSVLKGLGPDDVQVLSLNSVGNDPDPLSHLAQWTGLRLLLIYCAIPKTGYGSISRLTSLEGLRLGGTEWGDDDLKYLAPLASLRDLDLSRTPVTDQGLRNLQNLTALESLTIGFSNINGSGFADLRGLKSLRTLWLNGSMVGNSGLQQVAGLETLQRLFLYRTRVSDKGLASLRRLKSLRELDLHGTKVTDQGLDEIAHLTLLENLSLPGGTTDAGLIKLKPLTGLKHLDLGQVRSTGAGLDVLKGFRSLQYLQFPSGVTDADLAAIQELGSLEELWIQNSSVTNEGMAKLSGLKSLNTLLINNLPITGAALVSLKELPLRSLEISKLPLGNAGFAGIGQLSSLERLQLHGVPLADEDLAAMGRLRKMTQLTIWGSPAITDKGIAHLASMTSLEELQVDAPKLTDESFRLVAGLKQLRLLSLAGDFTEEGLHALEGLRSLQSLYVTSTNDLAAAKVEELRRSLPLLETMQIRRDKSAYRGLGIGQTAPKFALKTLDGREIKLEDYRGKVVLLYFWATWCSPCVASTPGLKEFHDQLSRHKDFAMLSLSLDTADASPRRHAERYKLTWPQVRLGEDSPVAAAYGVRNAVPVYILVGPDGKVLLSEEHNWGKIAEAAEKAFKTAPATN